MKKKLITLLAATFLMCGTSFAQDVKIQSVTLTQSQVVGGQTLEGEVVLAQPAPAEGFEVELWVDDSARVPTRVVVPAGARSVPFSVKTTAVNADQSLNVAALSPHSSAHTGLKVLPGSHIGLTR